MTRTRRPIVSLAAVAVAASLVAGCGSTPQTNFYTLASVPADPATVASPVRPLGVVAVGPVSLPDYVDRPQIVTRSSPYAMSLAPFDQWAGPLGDMVPRVLVENMAERLPGDRVVEFPQVSGPTFNYRVAISVTRFDVDASNTATLSAGWQVYEPQTAAARVIGSDTFQRQATAGTYEAYVAALSYTLGDLSERVIQSLATARGTSSPPLAAR